MPFWEKNKKTLLIMGVLIIIVVVVFGIPYGLNISVINNDAYSKSSPDGWASFFGSFLGGVIGGGATLLAVLATISHNRKELDRQDEKERNEIIRKSAIIVYYDFKFAFGNIKDFMNDFSKLAGLDGPIKEQTYVKAFDAIFKSCMLDLDQLYFDTDWIKTVANLAACDDLNIEEIYKFYGNLITIKKTIGSTNQDMRLEALLKMETFVEGDYNKQPVTYELNEDVDNLMGKLREKGKLREEDIPTSKDRKPPINDGETTADDEIKK